MIKTCAICHRGCREAGKLLRTSIGYTRGNIVMMCKTCRDKHRMCNYGKI